jgi:manganese/zinc/iron transport system ATP- binding protein
MIAENHMPRVLRPVPASGAGDADHRLSQGSAQDPPPIALSVRGLTVAYGDKPAVFDVDAAFVAGQATAVAGPNGAGKSTLLKAVLGLIPVVSGEVRFFGQPLAAARRKIAYVPQRASVDWDFPARAQDVVAMGLYPELGLFGRFGPKARRRVAQALDQVGMAAFADQQIGQLSGGQAQRVFIARALVTDADLIILDEPFAGVDAATEAAIIKVLADLKAGGKTIISVHHDLATLANRFDRVLLISQRVIAHGDVATVLTGDNLQRAYGGRLAGLPAPAETPAPAPIAVPPPVAVPAGSGRAVAG